MDLCNPGVIKSLLGDEGTHLRKEYGQNFLIRSEIPERIAEECTDRENSMILEIEVEGMRQVKAKMPEAVTIFIAPPSIDDLAKRIKKRNPDEKEEVIEKRVSRAKAEMEFTSEYDHIVVNGDLQEAFEKLSAIIADYIRE